MDHHRRALKSLLEAFKAAREIDDFSFETGKKHPKINIKIGGRLVKMSYSMSPANSYAVNFVERDIRRLIKNGAHPRVQ